MITSLKNLFKLICLLSLTNYIFSQDISKLDIEAISNLSQNELEALVLGQNIENIENPQEESANDFSLDSQENDLQEEASIEINENIYGHSFFKSFPKSITATSDLPLPNDYVVSVNDEIQVVFTGNKKNVLNLKVGLDGSLLLPEVGSIQASGITLARLKERISDTVEIAYVGVDVDVSVIKLSAKKIILIGAVKKPGTYLVNPYTTLSNALLYSSGVEDFASLRNIKLLRGDKIIDYDLYDLLIYGDRSSDVTVQQGDTILVQGTNNFVEITGQVLRPMIYEYKETDEFEDLINFTLGFGRDANIKSLTLKEKVNERIISSSFNLNEKVNKKNLVDIYINRTAINKNLQIVVRGTSVEEGVFSREKYSNLAELVNDLKFADSLWPFFAIVEQETENGKKFESFHFSLQDNDLSQIQLKNNVNVRFFSREDINEYQVNEDIIPIKNFGNIVNVRFGSADYRLPLSGRVSPKILSNYFGFTNQIQEEGSVTSLVSNIIKNSFNEFVDSDNLISINVPVLNKEFNTILITGAVKYPGQYILPEGSMLQDAYDVAGGFLDNADQNSIILTREAIKEREMEALKEAKNTILQSVIGLISNTASVGNSGNLNIDVSSLLMLIKDSENSEPSGRVSGNLASRTEISENLMLFDKDEIRVPLFRNTITVVGEVLRPSTLTFNENMTINDYIKGAGSFNDYADKRNIYVIKSNGTAEPLYTNSFSQKNIYLEPGDTIVVPRDLTNVSGLPLVTAAAQILSNIAFAAASLNSLSN